MFNTLQNRLAGWIAAPAIALMAAVALPSGAAHATDIKIGAMGFVAPKYEGSDEYRVLGAPYAFPIFSDARTAPSASVSPRNPFR